MLAASTSSISTICQRQLWLYLHGIRPEHLNASVQLGEATHDILYKRSAPVDLGAAQLDHLDGEQWVHEVKSSSAPTAADEAQAIHYCYRLHQLGVPAEGAILHYPKTRRTKRVPYAAASSTTAEDDICAVLAISEQTSSPPRLPRTACRGCSFTEYCWAD